MELDIASLAKFIGENTISERFVEASQGRKRAMDSVFWNEKKGQWVDYWLTKNSISCKVIPTYKVREALCHDYNNQLNIPYVLFFIYFRKLTSLKHQTRIRTYLLQTLFLSGLIYLTQVCNSRN